MYTQNFNLFIIVVFVRFHLTFRKGHLLFLFIAHRSPVAQHLNRKVLGIIPILKRNLLRF